MVKTGSSEVIGSWNTIAATRPRIEAMVRLSAVEHVLAAEHHASSR